MGGMIKELNIIVAGVGGQGSILMSHIIGNSAIKEGYRVRVAETYGASMRGGAVSGHIRIGTDVYQPLAREDEADVLIALEPLEGARIGVKYLSQSGITILNTRPLKPVDVNIGRAKYPDTNEIIRSLEKLCKRVLAIDAVQIAERCGDVRTLNMVMLGALVGSGKIPISIEKVKETIREHAPKGTEEMNIMAFELGYKKIQELIEKQ
jgi:indolepyruvate ferredoxin oxidoreductase beta subunit